MDQQVATHPVVTLLAFLLLILLLLFLIARWRWHVFLALLLPIILFGIVPGVNQNNFIEAFEVGFGKTLGKIGVVIVLGSLIAEALRHTGAISVITKSIVNVVGAARMPLALTLAGFVLGIAIFSDVAYVILNPLVHASAIATGTSIATMATGLVGALQLTHAIVPPTPGPLAAAALVGADIGKTIIFGSIACLVGSLAGWAYGKWIAGPRIHTPPSAEMVGEDRHDSLIGEISTWRAYGPIVVPVFLISMQSLAVLFVPETSAIRKLVIYLGWPVVALSIGVILAFWNIKDKGLKADARSKWVESALRTSAMILVVTGLGGSLSEILKGTPAVSFISDFFTEYRLPAIILPFIVGIIGNMITGSTTVGVITAGSIVAPMLTDLNLSPEAAMLSGASGSVIIKYVNSSYFWVCTSLCKLDARDGIIAFGGSTLVGGTASFITVYIMWAMGVI